jgi:hypothetical protein
MHIPLGMLPNFYPTFKICNKVIVSEMNEIRIDAFLNSSCSVPVPRGGILGVLCFIGWTLV